jgi:hypothetical protein
MTNPLYPRTIAVHRSKTNAVNSSGTPQIGLVGYSGRDGTTSSSDPEGETVLFTGIPASIQARSQGRSGHYLLPSDTSSNPQWRIYVPSLPQYSIRDRDIIVDDEGYRYDVVQNYFTGLGYQLSCIRLET